MKAIVTGCAGFIGSHLVEELLTAGAEVVGCDSFTDFYDPDRKRHNLSGALQNPRFSLRECDLAVSDVDSVVEGADVVFHLAAQAGVRTSWSAGFDRYVESNVVGTQRLLESVVRLGCRSRVVYASSSSVYGNGVRQPSRECDATRPYSPYGVTKLAAEHLMRVYAENFGVGTVSLRFFTVYGPRQRPDMAIQRLVECALSSRTFTVFGDGSQRRDFTFVSDVVRAVVSAALADVQRGSVFNIAGGSKVSLLDVLQLVETALDRPVQTRRSAVEPGDVRETSGAIDAARAALAWEPEVSIAEGIQRQARWALELAMASA